jgi:hypothetical protein
LPSLAGRKAQVMPSHSRRDAPAEIAATAVVHGPEPTRFILGVEPLTETPALSGAAVPQQMPTSVPGARQPPRTRAE